MSDMQSLFIADKKLAELEALFACDVTDDDDFYDVLAYNISRVAPAYFVARLGDYTGARLRGAVFGLGLSPQRDESQKGALTALLSHDDPRIIAEAIDALRNSEHQGLWQAVGAFAGHPSPHVRGAVARFARFSLLPEEAFMVLQGLLNDADPSVRQNAIDELGELGDRKAIDAIRRFLQDPNEDVRVAAASAINALGSGS